MPQANITYNAPYNRALVDKIDEMEAKHFKIAGSAYYPSPMGFRLGSYHGEAPRMIGGGSHSQMYISPGNSPAYPPFNMNAGMAVSSGGSHYSGIDGAVGGRFNLLKAVKSVGQKALPIVEKVGKKVAEKALMSAVGLGTSGGVVSGGRKKPNIGKILGSIAKKALPIVEKVGTRVAENALMGAVGLGTSGGRKKSGIESAFNFAVKHPDKLAKAFVGLGKKKPNARAQIVKRIMKERGVKLIEASKIVKAEGLY
jgi:hypothetical protein